MMDIFYIIWDRNLKNYHISLKGTDDDRRMIKENVVNW